MTIKRLHTKIKIFFPDPYVVRVEYPDGSMDEALADYRKITRSAYRLLKGTWGYSQLEYETWSTNPLPLVPFAHLTPNQQISSLFSPDSGFKNVLRGYVCFADEMDALQFRLSISSKSLQVHMWPKREFTIHEVIEEDES